MSAVAIIDYGMGNLHSIAKALQHAAPGARIQVSAEPADILRADRVVFPGVGAIRDCMNALHQRGLAAVIQEVAAAKPLLGVCLGMQALLDQSEENGGVAGLGLIPGKVVRFREDLTDANGVALKIPHMGWNRVDPVRPHRLWDGIDPGSRFYFVHSYYACPEFDAHVAATTDYPTPFAAALVHENLFAVQFHPEKSQVAGLRLLANFVDWSP